MAPFATTFITTYTASITGTSSTVAPVRTSHKDQRAFITITNLSAAQPVYLAFNGAAAVASAGAVIPATLGASVTYQNFSGAITGITASSTATVTVVEGFYYAAANPDLSSSSSSSSSTSSLSSESSSTKVSLSSSSSSTAVSVSSSTAVSLSSSSSSTRISNSSSSSSSSILG